MWERKGSSAAVSRPLLLCRADFKAQRSALAQVVLFKNSIDAIGIISSIHTIRSPPHVSTGGHAQTDTSPRSLTQPSLAYV